MLLFGTAFVLYFFKCDVLLDLVPFVQFKKREKHPWRNVTFSKNATLLKVTLIHGRFSLFLNCTNITKSRNASQWYASENCVA